jgi:hypothetical protein
MSHQSSHVSCQNCSKDFTIEIEDFEFYEKIEVPAPTFCPDCRLQRRLGFLNLTTLYKRPCDLCKKNFISMYHNDAPFTVYCPTCWWSDTWDFRDYGQDYDFSKPFFTQWQEIFQKTPLLGLSLGVECLENSPYNNHAGNLNHCYLTFQSSDCQETLYSLYSFNNRQVVDCNNLGHCELCYDIVHGFKSNQCIGCYNIIESMNCYFMRDCSNCQDCIGCTNIRNGKYCWFNEQLSKEEYQARLSQYDFGSFTDYTRAQSDASAFLKTQPPKPLHVEMSPGSNGNFLFTSNNCKDSFDSSDVQDGRFLFVCATPLTQDTYDVSAGTGGMEQCYEGCVIGVNARNVLFSFESCFDVFNITYCKLAAKNTRNCFGCVSPRGAEYCILNKQYTKEEYEKLIPQVKQHMTDMPYTDTKGRIYTYGEFFPLELSPFAYNDTLANVFTPIDESEIRNQAYRQYQVQNTTHTITIQAKDLPDHIRDVPDNIISEVIACEKTGKAFQIQPAELQFLRRMNLPLPRKAPIERVLEKTYRWAKEMKLIQRQSSISDEKFMTPYTAEEAPFILSPDEYKREFLS